MAKNREPEKAVEPESESGEEEDGSSSEELESDSEPEQTPAAKTRAVDSKSQLLVSAKPQQQQPPASSDEEGSGSEVEPDSDEEADPKVKPIASKAMQEPLKSTGASKKSRSKASASEPLSPTKSGAAKRPAEAKETDAKYAKKSKKAEPDIFEKSGDDSKKLLFQRLWSEDDELVLLKGMAEYANKKKSDPIADLNAFHDFIKKDLHVEVSRVQLQDKIRRLKKKYENNKSKEKEGKDRNFSKPHEQKAYELSKKVWGDENGKDNGVEKGVGSSMKANGSVVRKTSSKRAAVEKVENEENKDVKSVEVVCGRTQRLWSVSSEGMSAEKGILAIGAELFEGDRGLEGEDEWKNLRLEEVEICQRQMEVRSAQAKLVKNALKSLRG